MSHVTQRYKFASLTELNSVLKQFNVVADRGREGLKMYEKNELVYRLLDGKGNKVGVPIKASALSGKLTLKSLQAQFKINEILRQPHRERITTAIDSFFNFKPRHTKIAFCDYMNTHGINAVFRENKEGKVYGLTFIDNKQGCVFNGRDLGKEYSVQSLIHRLQDIKTGESEKLDLKSWGYKSAIMSTPKR